MALPLEANSLSSITQLARNPPKYPRSSTQKKREPLVLYLARVPGKRDIILTTIKPRLKNVTAEDVMNSLYYLHLDLPSDALLLEDTQLEEDIGHVPDFLEDSVAPKPSMRNSNAMPELSTAFGKQPPPSPGGYRGTQWENPNLGTTQSVSIDSWPPPNRPAPTVEVSSVRRPLGPRPLFSQPQTSRKPLPGAENIPVRTKAPLRISNPGYKTRLPESGRPNEYEIQSDAQNRDQSAEFGYKSDHSPIQTSNPFSITLIRRDPASGAQWTIGKITANPLSVRPSVNTQPKTVFERRCSSVSINLTTEGYCQFGTSLLSRTERDGENLQRIQMPLDTQRGFEREVQLSASSFWKGKFKGHRRGSSDQSSVRKSTRTSNSDSRGSLGTEDDEPGEGNRGRPWEVPQCGFLSPWNGRCDFATGSSGRTLKCKHTLPNSTSANNISELRFNLPAIVTSGGTTKSLADSLASETKHFSISKARAKSFLSAESRKLRPSSQPPHPTSYVAMYPSSDDDISDADDDAGGRNSLGDRVDPLGLGREKAGGGIRGKRVKLGKLIIHDEGLKMLDLVVAANMGVWWTIWDR